MLCEYLTTYFSGVVGRKLVILSKIVLTIISAKLGVPTLIRCVNGRANSVRRAGAADFVYNNLKSMVAGPRFIKNTLL